MLAPDGVVTWDAPVTRDKVVRTLLNHVVPLVPGLAAVEALRQLNERDALGPTAIGEGVDLPHARMDGVKRPVFAIGRTRAGLLVTPLEVADPEPEAEPSAPGAPAPLPPEQASPETDPIEVVWLLLLPPGGAGLGPTAQVARACRDHGFREALRRANSTDEVRLALERWALAQAPPPAPWST